MAASGPVRYMEAITRRYASLGYQPYRWFEADSPPAFTPLAKPLAHARVGLLSTSGGYVAGQVAYHYKDDTSVRTIARDVPRESLRFAHITESYLEGPRRDPDSILPLGALRAARDEGRIGELAPSALTCMGGIYSQRRVREELIPSVASHFAAEHVDAALLVPM